MTFSKAALSGFLALNPDNFIDACRFCHRRYPTAFRKDIARIMFPELKRESGVQLLDAYDICALLGDLAFSFPEWRFATISGSGNLSLIEKFGFQKLRRPTDVLDARLPDPARDLYGTGYKAYGDNFGLHTELRRAYMLKYTGDVAVLVRNSGFYFGRDRLPHCAYISLGKTSPAALENLVPDMFLDRRQFVPITELFSYISNSEERRNVVFDVVRALLGLVRLRREFGSWLLAPAAGLPYFRSFIKDRIARNAPLPVLGLVNPDATHEIGVTIAQKVIDDRTLRIFDEAIAGEQTFYQVGQRLFGSSGFVGDVVMLTDIRGDRPKLAKL